ncbi:MAG: hypothetical protein KA297_08080 [Kofleriaceae bacterium]|nr:hypothetical protein [Kofleriaceae bacterium]
MGDGARSSTTAAAPRQAGQPTAQLEAGPGAGLQQVKAMGSLSGEAGASAVLNVIRAHPEDRDDIMAFLHQRHGMAMAGLVAARLGQLEREVPGQVELRSMRASVTIPGGRELTGDFKGSVVTQGPTTVTVEVTPTQVRIRMSPSLLADVTFPVRNAWIDGAGINLATGAAFADVRDGGTGVVSSVDAVGQTIIEHLTNGIAGTPLAKPGYAPMQDPDLRHTLDAVISQFNRAFTSKGGGGKPSVGADELRDVSAGATFALRGGASFVDKGTGLDLAPGAAVSIDIDGGNSVGGLLASAGDVKTAASAAQVRAVRLRTEGMMVYAEGAPVARIHGLRIARGGALSIAPNDLELLGKAAEARQTESGLAGLVSALALAVGRPDVADGAYRHAQHPTMVSGMARAKIEKELAANVIRLLRDNRHAVGGVDLVEVLGL